MRRSPPPAHRPATGLPEVGQMGIKRHFCSPSSYQTFVRRWASSGLQCSLKNCRLITRLSTYDIGHTISLTCGYSLEGKGYLTKPTRYIRYNYGPTSYTKIQTKTKQQHKQILPMGNTLLEWTTTQHPIDINNYAAFKTALIENLFKN